MTLPPGTLSARVVSCRVLLLVLALGPVGMNAAARAGTLELVARIDPTLAPDAVGGSEASASADGRYVAFASSALNLFPGQKRTKAYGLADVFLLDRVTGGVVLVSRKAGASTAGGNKPSQQPSISADGAYVAFLSTATDLVAGQVDMSSSTDLFLFERATGNVTLVSRAASAPNATANGEVTAPTVLSADGRYVAYQSRATNAVTGQLDANGFEDVFLFDRVAGTNVLVSHNASGTAAAGSQPSERPSISADGRWIAFESAASDLVAGQSGASGDFVFLYDRTTTANLLVSHAVGAPATATGFAYGSGPKVSADGAFVAYASTAPDVVAGQVDPSGNADVFLWDRAADTTTLVSHASGAPATAANAYSSEPRPSADGRYVAFLSQAGNLVGALAPGGSQAYLFDRLSGTNVLASGVGGSPTTASGGAAHSASPSADGRYVLFSSAALDVVAGQVDTNGGEDLFLFDRLGPSTVLVSRTAGLPTTTGDGPTVGGALAADGSAVVFSTLAANVVAGVKDSDAGADVFRFDRATAVNGCVSCRHPALPSGSPDGAATARGVSDDGRFALFTSGATNVVVGLVDANAGDDAFLRDRMLRTTTLVSHAAGLGATAGNAGVTGAMLSADGAFVAYTSRSTNVVPGQVDVAGSDDVFLWDRVGGGTALVSHAPGLPAQSAGGAPVLLAMSRDGRYVAYASKSENVIPGQADATGTYDLFVYDRLGGTNELVTHVAGAPATAAAGLEGISLTPSFVGFSGDGRFVVFESHKHVMVAGAIPSSGSPNVYLYDRLAGTAAFVSHAASLPTTAANGASKTPRISEDGHSVVFTSAATNLEVGQVDGPLSDDVFLWDRLSSASFLVSHAAGAIHTSGGGRLPSVSADGRFVAFESDGSLVAGMPPAPLGATVVYLFDRDTYLNRLVSHAAGAPTGLPDDVSGHATVSADGSSVLFESAARNLVAGQTGAGYRNVFRRRALALEAELVTRAGAPSAGGNDVSFLSGVSREGRFVLIDSRADDLVVDDFNTASDAYLSTDLSGSFFTLPPCRAVDTRVPGSGPPLASNVPRAFPMTGVCGVPATARSVSVNVTITGPTGGGFLTFYPANQPVPSTSTINFTAGQTRANDAVVTLAIDGAGTFAVYPYVSGLNGIVDLIVDVNGYFE